MSKFKVLAVALLSVWTLPARFCQGAEEAKAVGSVADTTPTGAATETTATLRRRLSPPAWQIDGRLPKVLRKQPGEVQKASHFDTLGDESQGTSRRNAAQRLKDARKSPLYDAVLGKMRNKQPSTKTITTPTTVHVPGAGKTTQPATTAAPQRPASSKSANKESVSREEPLPAVDSSQSAAEEEETDLLLTAPADSGNNGAAPELETVTPEAEADPEAVVDPMPAPTNDESGHEQPVEIQPESEAPFSIPDGEEAKVHSVMTRSSLVHQLNPSNESAEVPVERMKLTPIEGDGSKTGDDELHLSATPAPDGEPQPVEESPGDILIEDESPVLSVRTRGPKTIAVGKSATYAIEIMNSSAQDAKDVTVTVNIPTWTDVTRHEASAGAARLQPDDRGNTVMQWAVGRLPAEGREALTLDIVPRGSRPFDLAVNWSFNPVHTMAQIQVQEPKLEISVVGPQEILFGETKVYTITVSNPGSGDAENVVLQLLPLIPGDPATGVRQLGVLKAGTRRTVEVELTARQPGRLQIRAEAQADGGLHTRGQQEVLVRRANLEIKVEGPPMKYAGTKARYTVEVTNSGDAMAQDVVALATLPSEARSISATDHATVHEDQLQVQWELGSLRPGSTRRFEVECLLNAAGTNRVDIRTIAAGNLTAIASAETAVESLADLMLVVNDPKGAVATGTDVVYEVRITNRGTKEARDIQVVGYFSEGIEPTSVAGWSAAVSEGQVELETISRLGPGQEMVLKITAQANRPGNHVFRAELSCNNPETRLASEEWTRFYGEPSSIRQADRRQQEGKGAAPQ
jgi:uncharacterized repeat protein (TIGR01451 family)